VLPDQLHVGSVVLESAFLAHLLVLLLVVAREAPLARDDDELTARELELGTTERLDRMLNVLKSGNINKFQRKKPTL